VFEIVFHVFVNGLLICVGQFGEEDGDAEMVITGFMRITAHHDTLRLDPMRKRFGKLDNHTQFGHQRNGPYGVTRHTAAADVIDVVQYTRARLVLDALKRPVTARVPPPFIALVMQHIFFLQ